MLLTTKFLFFGALVPFCLCAYHYSYEPGLQTSIDGTNTTNAALPADDMTLNFDTTGGSPNVVIIAHIARVQHSDAAASTFFVVTVDSEVIAEQEQGDRTGYKNRPMTIVVAATALTPGTHTVQVLYRTTQGTASFHFESTCGEANQYLTVLRPAAVYQTVVTGAEVLNQSTPYIAFGTTVSTSVTVAASTALSLFAEIDKHQHTVQNSVSHYRVTVDGNEACRNVASESRNRDWRNIVFSCVYEVSAGAHTIQLEYKADDLGATVHGDRRLIVVPLHDTQGVAHAVHTPSSESATYFSSTDWDDIPEGGLNVSYTAVTDEQSFVFFSVARVQTLPASKCMQLRILLDGSTQVAMTSLGGVYSFMIGTPAFGSVVSLTAGVHTFTAQYRLKTGSSTGSFANNQFGQGQNYLYVTGPEVLAGIQGDPLLTRLDGSSVHVHLHEGVFNLFSSSDAVVNVLVDVVATLPPEENTVVVGVGVLARVDGVLLRSFCGAGPGFADCFMDHDPKHPPNVSQTEGDGCFVMRTPTFGISVLSHFNAVLVLNKATGEMSAYAPTPFLDVSVQATVQQRVSGLVGDTQHCDLADVADELSRNRYTVESGCIFGLDAPSSLISTLPVTC